MLWDSVKVWFLHQDQFELLWIATIVTTMIILSFLTLFKRKQVNLWFSYLMAIMTDFILISTYYDFYVMKVGGPKGAWAWISGSLIFLLVIFLKVLLCFIIYSLIVFMAKPENMSEFVAKFCGIEIQYKRNVNSALENMKESKRQIEFITAINDAMLQFLSSSFEQQIVFADDIYEKIRDEVRTILEAVYVKTAIEIFVIPISDEGYQVLERKLKSLVKLKYNRGYDIATIDRDRIGIGIYRAGGGINDSAIVIDTTKEGYTLTAAEMASISNLYVAISTIINWAQLAYTEN